MNAPGASRSPARFWNRLADHGQATALVSRGGEHRLSYAKLAQRCDSIQDISYRGARGLVFLSVRPDFGGIAHVLAALRAGHAIHLLKSELPDAARLRLIELYQPTHVTLPQPDGAYRTEYRPHAQPALHPDLALLLSTSGSTGSGRMVRLSAQAMETNAGQIIEALRLEGDDCSLLNLPLSYTYGLSVLSSHLACGASLALDHRSVLDASLWADQALAGWSGLHGVPASYRLLRSACKSGLTPRRLKRLTQSGGRMVGEEVAWLARASAGWGARLYKMYGLTEATARVSVLAPEDLEDHPDSVGKAVAGGRLEIDPSGEILYHGPNVMMGYATQLGDLALGDLSAGRLSTQDEGSLNSQGFLFVRGRLDRAGKINGLRINLDEVEGMYFTGEPAAIVARDENIVIFHEDSPAPIAARARAMAADLRILPSHIKLRQIDSLPRTHNGKISYAQLNNALG